jgi:hypothetical protein
MEYELYKKVTTRQLEIRQRKIKKERKTKQPFNPEIVTDYETLLAEYIRVDNLFGPGLVLNFATHEATVLFDAVRAMRGPERQIAVRLAAKYEEFLGWLYQDAGRLDLAYKHTNQAHNLSAELHNPQLTAYILMRKSNIASDFGNPALALTLVNTALSQTKYLPSTDRAVILRQIAHSFAGLGDAYACADTIAEALEVAGGIKPDDPGLAPYCTIHYVAMEAAASWLQLDRPKEALFAFMVAPN